MKKINNKGMSIIELLVLTGVGSVAVFGLVNTSQQVFKTSQLLETNNDANDFQNSVYEILNNKCKDILDPVNLTTPPKTLPDGSRLQNVKTMPKIFDVDAPNTPDTPSNMYKQTAIQVVDITLRTPQGANQNTKEFKLFYKYTLGDKQTRDGEECTQAANKKKGCYHISCNIDYNCPPPCNNKANIAVCNPLDCVVEGIFDNCESGEFLVGPSQCVGCDNDQTLIGTKEDNAGVKRPVCLEMECKDKEESGQQVKQVAIGVIPLDPNADPDPDTNTYIIKLQCKPVACPNPSQHRVLSSSGEMECKKICHGGQRPKANGKCGCPGNQAPDKDGNCACADNDEKLDSNGNCICKGSKIRTASLGCQCPSPYDNGPGGTCYCQPGHQKNNDCICRDGPPKSDGRCPPPGGINPHGPGIDPPSPDDNLYRMPLS